MNTQPLDNLISLTAAPRAGSRLCVAGQTAPTSYFYGYWFSHWRA